MRRVFALLKAVSRETDLIVMLGDFTLKKKPQILRFLCLNEPL